MLQIQLKVKGGLESGQKNAGASALLLFTVQPLLVWQHDLALDDAIDVGYLLSGRSQAFSLARLHCQ